MSSPIDLVLFDLGGVLLEVPGVQAMADLTGITSEEEIWRCWLACPWVRRFESGRCTEKAFADGLVKDWGLTVSAKNFLEGFRRWLPDPSPGAEQLVLRCKSSVPVACMSNINISHWRDGPLMQLFEYRFLSFETGLLKPDAAAFEHVAEVLRLPPKRVLFLDDNAVNVDAAAAVGFQSARVSGVTEARQCLVDSGVLEAGARHHS